MKVQLYNEDNSEVMKRLPDESIDVICIDPPYLYLKNQKLERPFNERFFFMECARLLTKDGFIVMFGRGDSFYRWNNLLNNLIEYKEGAVKYGYKVFDENGNIINKYKFKENIFTFKEEIVWNKRRITSPALPLGRLHECIVIFSKGNGKINKCIVPYDESKYFENDKIVADIKRVESTLRSPDKFKHITESLSKKNKIDDIYKAGIKQLHAATYNGNNLQKDVGIATLNSMLNGCLEKSIIDDFGVKYQSIHPTQKPVRLLERLLKLVLPMKKKKITVADWFGGSFSCCEAVINLQSEFPDMEFEFIGTEIDKEYYTDGEERINKILYPDIY